jgi:hypothetical protein
MKKLLGFLVLGMLVSAMLCSLSFAQSAYDKGARVVGGGIGLGGLAGLYGDAKLPPLSIGYDQGYNENISFGGIAGIASSEQKFTSFFGSYGWEYTYIIIGARGNYHFTELFKDAKMDPYVGLTLGYNIVSVKETGTIPFGISASGSYFLYGGHLGLRYYFSSNLGAQLEFGYGIGVLNLGIAYKM